MKLLNFEFLHGEVVPCPILFRPMSWWSIHPPGTGWQVPAGRLAIGPARLCHCPLRCLLEDGAKPLLGVRTRNNHQSIRVNRGQLGWWCQLVVILQRIWDDLWRAYFWRLGASHCCGSHPCSKRQWLQIYCPTTDLFLNSITDFLWSKPTLTVRVPNRTNSPPEERQSNSSHGGVQQMTAVMPRVFARRSWMRMALRAFCRCAVWKSMDVTSVMK